MITMQFASSFCLLSDRNCIFQRNLSQTFCNECQPGFVSATKAQEECTACSKGRFAEEKIMAFCPECPAGYKGPLLNLSSCQACNGGQFTALAGEQGCRNCAAGKRTSTFAPIAWYVLVAWMYFIVMCWMFWILMFWMF